MKISKRLKSRKFLLAVVSSLIVLATEGLGYPLPKEALMTIAGFVISYILGEAYVDAQKKEG